MDFVLLDDIPAHNDILEDKLTDLCRREGWNGHVVLKTTDKQQLLAHAAQTTAPTVYFLDILLGNDEDTLKLFHQLSLSGQEYYIIYVSAYPQYAMDCLHSHAFDFLLKPLLDAQLEDCMCALWRTHCSRESLDRLQISIGGRTLLIQQQDMIYCTRKGMNLHIYCTDGSSYTWRESFERFLPRLNTQWFYQSHRSYIVNLRYIREIHWNEDTLILSTGHELPLSRRRAAALKALLASQGGKL